MTTAVLFWIALGVFLVGGAIAIGGLLWGVFMSDEMEDGAVVILISQIVSAIMCPVGALGAIIFGIMWIVQSL